MSIRLSVVIPTYNRLDRLRVVMPTLLDQSVDAGAYELVIADSNSTDGSRAYLDDVRREYGARVRYLPGAYGGRAAARNAGITAARGDVVLFTDADILATRTLLERHLARHDAAGLERVAVVGCELQVRTFEDYVRQRDDARARAPLHPGSRRRLSWLYFLTGNASVRRDDLLAVGSFDEAFTGYGHEDLELGYRLERSGVRLLYEPDAVNFHWHPVGYEEQKGRMELAGISTVRFYRKHRDVAVMANLGMTPLSLALHSLLRAAGPLRRAIERAGGRHEVPRKNSWPYVARQIAYQYHYLNGVKRALREPGGAPTS